jgi:hypothetical protein
MQRHRRSTLVGILALCIGPAFAQESTRRDGNWWRTQLRASQVSYMVGFFDGIELGNRFSYWSFANDQKATESLKRVFDSYEEYVDKYLKNVTSGQMVDGLDTFYSDFRNRSILVHNAVWLVANQVAGVPQDRIDSMIESWRRNSSK